MSPFSIGFQCVFFFFLLSTSTSRFPVRSFFTVLGLDLLDIIFSVEKGDCWSNFVFCNDSIMMNLGKSLYVTESESDKYLLDFLKEAMIGVCFSLVLCSTTHHRVQLVLGISQGGKPIRSGLDGDALPVYSYQERNSESGFSAWKFNSCQNSTLNTIDPQAPPSSTYKIKGLRIVPQIQIELYIREKKHTGDRAWQDQPIDRIGPNPTACQTK